MLEKELIKQIKKLPSEAQQEAADFVEFLTQKYIRKSDAPLKKSILENSFRGIWKDRSDLQDGTK